MQKYTEMAEKEKARYEKEKAACVWDGSRGRAASHSRSLSSYKGGGADE